MQGETSRSHVFDDLMFLAVSSRRESFGLTILEAPFYNVLPVAFDSVGPRFLLKDVAPELLVPCGDTSAMAARLLMLFKSPARRSVLLSQLRRSFQERFSPQIVATNFVSVIENHANVHARSLGTV
jgi:glycosyltransferase involved in cell wall biosynthesis